jgi:hypothetical protein
MNRFLVDPDDLAIIVIDVQLDFLDRWQWS